MKIKYKGLKSSYASKDLLEDKKGEKSNVAVAPEQLSFEEYAVHSKKVKDK